MLTLEYEWINEWMNINNINDINNNNNNNKRERERELYFFFKFCRQKDIFSKKRYSVLYIATFATWLWFHILKVNS